MFLITIFFLGLAVGSFLNSLIYRLHKKESPLIGRSYCPKCKHQLGFWDLVPIFSFVFLCGRCRYCKKKISVQYPLVELATGLLFVFTAYDLGFTAYGLASYSTSDFVLLFRNLFFVSILVFVFIYDLKYWLIADKIVLSAAVIIFGLNLFLSAYQYVYIVKNLILAGAVGAGFFFLQYILSRGKWIGGGDIRLGLLLGFFFGWPEVVLTIFLAYVIGAVVSIGLVVSGQKKMKSYVPLGPFLVIAALIILFFGQQILEWYLK